LHASDPESEKIPFVSNTYFAEEDFTKASTVEYLGEREMLVDCKLGQRTFFSLEKNT
jgi:hypothetical protein